MKLKGNTFVVTGGASGLGEAVVVLLHQLGANVGYLLDCNEEEGQKLQSKLAPKGFFVKTDVTSEGICVFG